MLKIFDILRANSVKRWHIVETNREQRLSEHLFSVSVLAGEIAGQLGLNPGQVQLVMIAALFHDIDEIISGDAPTPTKQRIRTAGVEMNDLFKEYKIVDIEIMAQTIPQIEHIIKCADHLETVFFLRDHGVGRHASQVNVMLRDKAIKYFAEAGESGVIALDLLHKSTTVEYTI